MKNPVTRLNMANLQWSTGCATGVRDAPCRRATHRRDHRFRDPDAQGPRRRRKARGRVSVRGGRGNGRCRDTPGAHRPACFPLRSQPAPGPSTSAAFCREAWRRCASGDGPEACRLPLSRPRPACTLSVAWLTFIQPICAPQGNHPGAARRHRAPRSNATPARRKPATPIITGSSAMGASVRIRGLGL